MRLPTWGGIVGGCVADTVFATFAFLALGATAAVFVHAERGTAVVTAPFSVSVATDTLPAASEGSLVFTRKGHAAAPMRNNDVLPPTVFHDVPFSPQAPYGDWRTPYDEACEETSVAMAMAWVAGRNTLSPHDADEVIRWLVAYEQYHFGYHEDTAVRETLKLITHSYRYPYARITSASSDALRRELGRGNIVLLPVAGELLANPYYGMPPPYHMVVVVGYDDAPGEFIIHDPGTRRGRNFRYPYETVETATHDWTGSDDSVAFGAKRMIVVERPVAS